MSDFLNKYPYTDFHELNLDWVIERVKKLTEDWAATLEEWNSTEEQWQELYDYVHDYFDNLDVQQEINNKINAMIADGTFVTITTPVIEAKVASMMPATVASQIGDTVAGQIGATVAGQLPGVVSDQIDAAVVNPVNAWLADHITQPTTPAIDTSLSIAGAAADSAATGYYAFNHDNIISNNLMGVDIQDNLYPGAASWSGSWTLTDPDHMSFVNNAFKGYPAMHSTRSYRRIHKSIPIVSGKTYTFEAYIKCDTLASIFAYVITSETTSPATIDTSGYTQENNVAANIWHKIRHTFTCTASGNITPCAYASVDGFYVSKYVLVEGDEVFSLDSTLDDKASVQDASGLGDYKEYDFSITTSPGTYWNPEIVKNIPAGTMIRMQFNYYTGNDLLYVRFDGKKADNTYVLYPNMPLPVKGMETIMIASDDFVGARIQFSRSSSEANVSASVFIETDNVLGVSNDMLHSLNPRVFHIEKDGSGDFTSFVDGINYATTFMDSIVYVGAGTYDLLDELGHDYINAADGTHKGLVLKNRIHVICSTNTILTMMNDPSLYDSTAQYDAAKEYISPINTGAYGCILENATIIDDNMRYSIHDDQGWAGPTPYINKFINCHLQHTNGMYGDCIGGGLGENCLIEIRGCYLEGDAATVRLAYYHGNNHTGVTTAKGKVEVHDNYFANLGSFFMTNYGDSLETSYAYVSNNSFGSVPDVTNVGTTVDMIKWNNEVRP